MDTHCSSLPAFHSLFLPPKMLTWTRRIWPAFWHLGTRILGHCLKVLSGTFSAPASSGTWAQLLARTQRMGLFIGFSYNHLFSKLTSFIGRCYSSLLIFCVCIFYSSFLKCSDQNHAQCPNYGHRIDLYKGITELAFIIALSLSSASWIKNLFLGLSPSDSFSWDCLPQRASLSAYWHWTVFAI